MGFCVSVGMNSSAVEEKICKSRLLTKCLMVKMSPRLVVISKLSLSNPEPISKLKYSPDLDAHIPSGCDTVPASHSLFS